MSIIINIKPEAQAELTRQAAAHGVRPEAYAATLLEEAVHMGATKKLTSDQLDRTLQELAQFSASAGRAGGAPLLHTSQSLAGFWNASTRPRDKNGFGLSVAETDRLARVMRDEQRAPSLMRFAAVRQKLENRSITRLS